MDVLIDCISLAEADVEADVGRGGEGGVVQPKGREEKIPDELAPA